METKKKKMERLEWTTSWQSLFMDYVEDNNLSLYNKACNYADRIKMDNAPLES